MMRGFSLVELLVAVGITSLLVASGVPAFRSYQRRVVLDTVANDVAELVLTARTYAVSPDAGKQRDTVAYGVVAIVSATEVKFQLAEFSSGVNTSYTPGRIVQERVVPAKMASVVVSSSGLPTVVFPIEQRGASTASAVYVLRDTWGTERMIAVTGPTGQVVASRSRDAR